MATARSFRAGSSFASTVRASRPTFARQFHASSRMLKVREAKTEEEFYKLINRPLVAVQCYAEWCRPCKVMGAVFEAISDAKEFRDTRFLKVNIDELYNVAEKYNVSGVPTFFFFKNGEKTGEYLGGNPAKLTNMIEKGSGVQIEQ